MATCLGISPPTLRKHYKAELKNGAPEANARISASVYQMATTGKNIVAAIWWEKTRRGFSEKQRVETTGPDGRPIEQMVTYRWAEPVKE